MSDTNTVVLSGRLTKDVELVELNGGGYIAKSSIASNRVWGSGDDRKEDTLFLDFKVFGNQAKYFAENTEKGKKVLLQGRLEVEKWEDKNGGGPRRTTLLNVKDFDILERRPKENSDQVTAQKATGTTKTKQTRKQDDSIPF